MSNFLFKGALVLVCIVSLTVHCVIDEILLLLHFKAHITTTVVVICGSRTCNLVIINCLLVFMRKRHFNIPLCSYRLLVLGTLAPDIILLGYTWFRKAWRDKTRQSSPLCCRFSIMNWHKDQHSVYPDPIQIELPPIQIELPPDATYIVVI